VNNEWREEEEEEEKKQLIEGTVSFLDKYLDLGKMRN